MRWLLSRTPVTYLSKLPGICSFTACLQRELFGYNYGLRAYLPIFTSLTHLLISALRTSVEPYLSMS